MSLYVGARCPSCYVPGFLPSMLSQGIWLMGDGKASCTVGPDGACRLRSFAPPRCCSSHWKPAGSSGIVRFGRQLSWIARLVSLAPGNFRHTIVVSKLEFYLPLLGTIDNLLRPLKHGSGLLDSDLETVVKPNVKLLTECGLGARDIAKLLTRVPVMPSSKPECVLSMVACAEGVGVPCGSRMFRQALQAISYFSEEKITARVDYLKKTFRWSDAEVGIAMSKAPSLLRRSKKMLQCRSEFLIPEAGLGPAYIAHRSNMLVLSVEARLRPRYYVMKFLRENGLLKRGLSYKTVVKVTENAFLEKFICLHKEAAPHLAEDYATACRGKVPWRFIFT